MHGWSDLLAEARDHFRGLGRFPLRAYSESMPPPWVAIKPYATDHLVGAAHGARAFAISEYEQAEQLRPGLAHVAGHVLGELDKLRQGGSHQLSKKLLEGNPAWTPELAAAERQRREPLVICLPLALSRTQDDKGNTPWTLFGGSHLGPARPVWRSIHDEAALVRLLSFVTGVSARDVGGLRAAGVRVLPRGDDRQFAAWSEPLPAAAGPLVLEGGELAHVRVLFTLRAFGDLPEEVRRAYLEGRLRLVPSPASIVFFEHPGYRELGRELALAMQMPLLHLFRRRESSTGLRIPQSGWLEETRPGEASSRARAEGHPQLANTVQRSHRFERISREDDQAVTGFEHKVTTALFSSEPDAVGLYGKPMARNCQVWSDGYRLVLDGPSASWEDFGRAADLVRAGGLYGYRFYYTPMRAGARWLWWHLPLVARLADGQGPELMPEPPPGVITAERLVAPLVELEPLLLARPGHDEAARVLDAESGYRRYGSSHNVRRILEASDDLGHPLAPSFARRLLKVGDGARIEEWISRRGLSPALTKLLRERLGPELDLAAGPDGKPASLTLERTHGRDFEERLWGTISELAAGAFRDKDVADVVTANAGRTGGSLAAAVGRQAAAKRDLDALAAHLGRRHKELIERHGMTGRAWTGEQVFRWTTDFDFSWSQSWRENMQKARERNVVVYIPGRRRREVVVMADHYDTAYMEDLYGSRKGVDGDGLRASAAGADDNHSATAALLEAAQALLPLAKAGKLERSVLLVHLTGEEFPADCLGARTLSQALVERTLMVLRDGGVREDLSDLYVAGVFVLDMVGHNNVDKESRRDVFQIAPGEGVGAARLAEIAHRANQRWNRSVPLWNQSPERQGKGRSRRGATLPPIAEHPVLRGEVRPEWDRRSALYNTDGQIFSDVGVPVVLFMEDYDINREGYHDVYDTLENIDLDYCAGVVAVAIESVAEAASAAEL